MNLTEFVNKSVLAGRRIFKNIPLNEKMEYDPKGTYSVSFEIEKKSEDEITDEILSKMIVSENNKQTI